jgi:hypothetical protein
VSVDCTDKPYILAGSLKDAVWKRRSNLQPDQRDVSLQITILSL